MFDGARDILLGAQPTFTYKSVPVDTGIPRIRGFLESMILVASDGEAVTALCKAALSVCDELEDK